MTFEEARERFKGLPVEEQRDLLQDMIGEEIADLELVTEEEAEGEGYGDFIETLDMEFDRLKGADSSHMWGLTREYGFIVENLADKIERWRE